MSAEGSFDRTLGRLRILSAAAPNEYKVFVDGVEISGTFGSDVLNSLAGGEWTKYAVIQTRFNEQAVRLPQGLTADKFIFLMREFGSVPVSMLPPQNTPAAPA
jgi:hypothetical protein